MTVEVDEAYTDLRFRPHAISFLTDDIILQRYVEIEGQLRTVITVIKMRGRPHSPDFRSYSIGPDGLTIGERLPQYTGVITAVPRLREAATPMVQDGLTEQEAMIAIVLREAEDALPVDAILVRSGMDAATIDRILRRLVDLRYVRLDDSSGKRLYSAIPPRVPPDAR